MVWAVITGTAVQRHTRVFRAFSAALLFERRVAMPRAAKRRRWIRDLFALLAPGVFLVAALSATSATSATSAPSATSATLAVTVLSIDAYPAAQPPAPPSSQPPPPPPPRPPAPPAGGGFREASPRGPPADPASVERGKALYGVNCN